MSGWHGRLDHAEPWMIEVAQALVGVVKAADHFGEASFCGNGRMVRVRRATDGILIEFDYMAADADADAEGSP